MSKQPPPRLLPHNRRKFAEIRERFQAQILELSRERQFETIAHLFYEYGMLMERYPQIEEL